MFRECALKECPLNLVIPPYLVGIEFRDPPHFGVVDFDEPPPPPDLFIPLPQLMCSPVYGVRENTKSRLGEN